MDREILTYTDKTMDKVYDALLDAGLTIRNARVAVNSMQNAGILFRERLDVLLKEDEGKEAEICRMEQNREHNTTL